MLDRHSRRSLAALVSAALMLAAIPALPVAARAPVPTVARDVSVSVDRERVVELPIAATHVALHWGGHAEAAVTIAFGSDASSFGAAVDAGRDEVGEHRDNGETYGAVLRTDGYRAIRIRSDRPIPRLTVLALDSAGPRIAAFGPSGSVASAAVAQPAVISRSGWGADESLRFDENNNEKWPPEFYPVQKLIVHHTAGKNNDPDPEATIRSIYHYHAITQGWGDIGYNFLIDEAGRIYEGRYSRDYNGEPVTGENLENHSVTAAHVRGYNSGTVGVSLLGTLTNVDAQPGAREGLEQILAWKADRHGIDPHGANLYVNPVSGTEQVFDNISGHRDLAATECPGGTFYDTFPALRDAVSSRIGGTSGATVPAAPELTAAQPKKGKGVALSWTVPADGGSPISAYRIYRAAGTAASSFLTTVDAPATTYRDTATRRSTTYTYTVRAVNSVGEGPASNQASAVAR